MTIFNNIKIIKELGSGTFGTTYLAKYRNKKYALKIEKISKSNVKKSFKNKIWRELDLFNYISKLKPSDKDFFVKLHAYDIEKSNNNQLSVKYLIDYLGETTLDKYYYNHNLTMKQKISFILQIAKMMLILHKEGYSHNDLHVGTNIMVIKSKKKYFTINNCKIPFYGKQLVAIDYGEVSHKKFGINYKNHPFKKTFSINRDKHLFLEIFNSTYYLISDYNSLIEDCIKAKKRLPWERKVNVWSNGMKKLMNKHQDFFKDRIEIYGKIFPEHKKNLKFIFDNRKSKKSINQLISDKKITTSYPYNPYDYFYNILYRINEEFRFYHPTFFTKYFGWCSVQKINIPEKFFLKLLRATDYKDIVKAYVNML